jgi:hypothetical protein
LGTAKQDSDKAAAWSDCRYQSVKRHPVLDISPWYVVRKFVCQISFGVHPIKELRKCTENFTISIGSFQNLPGRILKYLVISVETSDFLLEKVTDFKSRQQL